MLDYKITGGQVLDGTGAPAIRADLGITGGRIAAIGDLSRAETRTAISVEGRVVCPGFIDVHSHSDTYLLIEPSAPSKIHQGITTEIVGNCGASAAPLADPSFLPSDWQEQIYPGSWRTVMEYLQLLELAQPAPNVAALIGHGKLRSWVMGYEARPAKPDELKAMCRLLEESLEAGGWGLSSGLIYAPGKWAAREELMALAGIAARHNGIYTSHLRSEGSHLLAAIEETLAIGRASGARVEISHLKTGGREHWSLLDSGLTLIRRARAEGVAVAADRYPYVASGTDLDVVLPDWATHGGRDAILRRLKEPHIHDRLMQEIFTAGRSPNDVVIGSTGQERFRGKPLVEVARVLELNPAEAVLFLLEADQLKTSAFFMGMSEPNMWRILAEPYVMLGSDASLRSLTGPLSRDFTHPRAYGSFPRFLRGALDGKTVPLPEAVRKMTSLAADHFGLKGRGTLAVGGMADIVVFDPKTVADLATFAFPHQLARGIDWVIVNGVVTLNPQGLTGKRGGWVIRR
ncbi:MAG: D-aminoacylase [Verrucomicrobia bacterium]|nr:D-aminoacylase [Verrucomicrobiota bacterium]MBU4427797.1 D-aminoacylase [Verrucomicrobiota bacterium]MCG2681376.1 D-aminoacylase [Kiritimatiellia bacterium]